MNQILLFEQGVMLLISACIEENTLMNSLRLREFISVFSFELKDLASL